MKSFIVEFWSKIFNGLRWISPFQLIRVLFPNIKKPVSVDVWVLGNLVFSMACLMLSLPTQIHWWEIIVLFYAGIRIFEVVIYQVNILLFDEYRLTRTGREYAVRGFRRPVLLLLHNYVEILFWFALFYRNLSFWFEGNNINSLDSFWGSLYFSLVTMSTLGYGDISPRKTWGFTLVIIQTLIGVFMALLILARFISLLPTPDTSDESEKRQ